MSFALKFASTILLTAFALSVHAADSSATQLAEMMKQARYSDGFTVRMNVANIKPDGHRDMPFKLAVVGQLDAKRQRLLIRGISPDRVRNHFIIAGQKAEGRIQAIRYSEPASAGIEKFDPGAPLFDSLLVTWDMLSPWWDWPQQSLGKTEQIAGRSCTLIRSQSGENFSPIREVISCVDRDAKLSLRTQLFDRQHNPIRTISVKETLRKESGALAAKRLTITAADRTVTEVEVYSGDEHYLVTVDTFARFDAYTAAER